MGWSDCGKDSRGRPIGYAFAATCDHPECEQEIHRGRTYACGDMHGEDEISCEFYFCERHLLYVDVSGRHVQLCDRCAKLLEKADPP